MAEADEFWGGGDSSTEPDTYIDLEDTGDGGVTVWARDMWRFVDRQSLFGQFCNFVNEYAARLDGIVVLHAGGVRTPDGRVLVLPGSVDAGKSTLTAALVQAGCDYLGDESIGVRQGTLFAVGYPKPMTMDRVSCDVLSLNKSLGPNVPVREVRETAALLAGDVGPIDEVVLPTYRPGSQSVRTLTEPREASRELLSNTLNLGRSGQEGLRTLAELAERVPVVRIVHMDSVELAAELAAGPAAERSV